nr:BTAD domain-containing putative transcriptional regulator [Micromonospora sp. DSM 115978]
MWFGVLGPLDARAGSGPVAVVGRRQRQVLAMLLVNANRPVAVTELTAAIWGDSPPAQSRRQVQNAISQIRSTLNRHGYDGLCRDAYGYRLSVAADALDLLRFEALVAAAQRTETADDPGRAVETLRTALALWRGPALSDLAGDRLRDHAARLDERRLAVTETYVRHALAAGPAEHLVDELAAIVAECPLRERLTAAYMQSLYRAGRQADALAAYRRAAKALADDLGIDPGPELSTMFNRVLRHDPELTVPPRGRVTTSTGNGRSGDDPQPATEHPHPVRVPVVPAQLPADVAPFTGRRTELGRLDDLLSTTVAADGTAGPPSGGEDRPTPLPITVVCGPPGVGKTALAVHWAHRVADRFRDGSLYVDLRGADPHEPMAAADALSGFLAALGVPGREHPDDLAGLAARFRTEVAGRRVLVMLDNAGSVDQVRPLLPGTGSCAVLVTSRDVLTGLVAVHGAHRVVLDVLPEADAHDLLCRLIGAPAAADRAAVVALAARCERLPLALRVAAELVVARPEATLTDLVAELDRWQDRLDVLDTSGDPRATVSTVFSWSVRNLPAEASRVLRLLSLHPGRGADPYAVAALAGTGLGPARQALATLSRAHLVHPVGDGRYGMHDLLRALADKLARGVDGEPARDGARQRLFDHYVGTASVAMDHLHPANRPYRPTVALPPPPVPDLAHPGSACRWLDTELENLIAVSTHGLPHHTIGLSGLLHRYLVNASRLTEAIIIHGHALQAARATGNLPARAAALLGLAGSHLHMCRLDPAIGYIREALALFQQTGNTTGQARALGTFGCIEALRGHYRSAIAHLRRGVDLFRQLGDRNGEGNGLNNLSFVELRLGDPSQAAAYSRSALCLYRDIGDPIGEPHALVSLGQAEAELGHLAFAAALYARATELFDRHGDRYGKSLVLLSLGELRVRLGCWTSAGTVFVEALRHTRSTGDRYGQAQALNGLGDAASGAGRWADSVAHHREALAVAALIGSPEQQARAHAGLARGYRAGGDADRARRHDEDAASWHAKLDR